MSMYESLHNHTTASDGTQTYAEVLATAKRVGLGTIAFTDHDMLPSTQDLAYLQSYEGPVKWLLGCEISSGLPTELGGSKAGMIHVLGLFTDPENKALQEHSRKAVSARPERMERMVANLRNLGFTISVDDCLEASSGENVGRPHIVRALNSHPENAAIIDSLSEQMKEEAKTDSAVAMHYMYMTSRRPSDRPYELFLSDDSYLKGVYVDYLYAIDLDDSVRLIREAGGRAAIAHWWTYRSKIDAAAMEELLTAGRLDFVEVCSGAITEQVLHYGKLAGEMAERLKLPRTIGVDGHIESDLVGYSREKLIMEGSLGQTKRFIEAFQPSLKWTNFEAK
jgi:predicted metal-dependent phosphoesterase TrpH